MAITKEMSQALSELNARFKYQTDKERYSKNEVWVLMELNDVWRL